MNIGFRTALAAGIALVTSQSPVLAQATTMPTNQADKVSYSVGMYIAAQIIKRNNIEVDVDIMSQGIKDMLAGHPKQTEQQAQEILVAYQNELRSKQEEKRTQLVDKNRADGQKFLAANKTKPGVKTHSVSLPDGTTGEFQYKVITEGKGDSPKPTDTALVNVKGTLLDGKEFENVPNRKVQIARNQAAAVREALPLMKAGAKWTLYIPANLAYGDFGNGLVEPGATVVYDVELVSFESPPAPAPEVARPMTSDIIKVPSREDIEKGAKIEVIKAEDAERQARSNAVAPPK